MTPSGGPAQHRGVSRPVAYVFSLAMLGAVLHPLLLDPQDSGQDSFPLSTYPMFSYDKPRTARVSSAVAIGPERKERAVPPEFVAGSETMQALRTIAKSVRAGKKQARGLCEAIARRIADSADPAFAGATRVALITAEFDSIDYLSGDRTPLRRKDHVRCAIARRAP